LLRRDLLLPPPVARPPPVLWLHPTRVVSNSCPYDPLVANPPPAPLLVRLRHVGSPASQPHRAHFLKHEPSHSTVPLILSQWPLLLAGALSDSATPAAGDFLPASSSDPIRLGYLLQSRWPPTSHRGRSEADSLKLGPLRVSFPAVLSWRRLLT